MDENIKTFVEALEQSLAAGTFIKMTLGNYKGAEHHLQKILVRPVDTKKGARLLFQYRYETRDVIKNFDFPEGVSAANEYLLSGIRSGHLFTTTGDFQLDIGKRNSRLKPGKPTFPQAPSREHNREKRTPIDPNGYYLKALGITTDTGEVRSSQQDKWRQINKFVEILSGLVENSSLKDKPSLNIVDMGSGKGYLTFAAYDYFANARTATPGSPPFKGGVRPQRLGGGSLPRPLDGPPSIRIIGVEARPELVALCNDIAKAGGLDGLNFIDGTIADFDPGDVDILIALHACDTATDDALYKGIASKAEIIVAAPCCHKEVRPQIKPPEMLSGILRHGIMLERTAETITDGLRSLLLERSGYATKLFEFIGTEHTPKNNMLVGTRTAKHPDIDKLDRQITEIKDHYGIENQHLEELLKCPQISSGPRASTTTCAKICPEEK